MGHFRRLVTHLCRTISGGVGQLVYSEHVGVVDGRGGRQRALRLLLLLVQDLLQFLK